MTSLKIYCDTNVFLDYLDNRSDRLRPLGLFAFEFFSRGWDCLFQLVVSDWTLTELRKYSSQKDIDELLGYFKEKNKLFVANCSPRDFDEAKKMSSHWQDALHFLMAKKMNCDKLVTRDKEGFSAFSSKIDICYPESV
ncbi:MAG: type II toxin-antitoxin system VapC family toxin [Candidatus Woesearchaeota archaeon]